MTVAEKFSNLGIDNAPGQESLQKSTVLEKAYWSMWQPIYQPLQGFRLIQMRI